MPTEPPLLDLTGDVCPMTFVRTKLELEELPPGAELAVLLRAGESLRNVPRSCEAEGHVVLSREEIHPGVWRLRICKGG